MTPKLFESLTKQQIEKIFDANIRPGAVFRMHVPHTSPPKVKRFIVIGVENNIDSIAFLFVNSTINLNKIRSSKLKKLHLPLGVQYHTFLDYDSFLDCSHLYEWSIKLLKKIYTSDPTIYLGQLSTTTLEEAKQLVISAKTIKKIHKKRYGFI